MMESSSDRSPQTGTTDISHPRFATFYTWMSNRPQVRKMEDPFRRKTVGQAHGLALEVGAGGGQNFPFYDAQRVTHLEATEPDDTMLATARRQLAQAPIPITLTKAAAETLPFPDEHFDSVVVTLVFCSVRSPERGLSEIWRVLKPGGSLLMLEHVRSQGRITAWIQDTIVPLTTRVSGNCHWNRDTKTTIQAAGFQLTHVEDVRGGLLPILRISATRP